LKVVDARHKAGHDEAGPGNMVNFQHIASLRRPRYAYEQRSAMTETAHFGSRQVPLTDRQALVDDVFRSVARRYDLMNDLMSFGLHRAWKDALVTAVDPPRNRPFTVIDIAGGTGDVALRMIRAGGEQTRVTVCDINADMLAIGRERIAIGGIGDAVTFTEANAEALPFADRSFDAATIAFGIRNVARIEAALGEAFRVLKIGGKFLCLEFSAVDVPGLDRLYDLYSFNVIPVLGRTVAGDAESYRYLVESIRRFPRPQAFAAMLRAAGFGRVTHKLMTGGIVALHCGWRL
jgi:demethylmenaquinone methyltransferase/2-methoxy-6-polyprenyl-1,4-benzoquinol methylase